MAEYEQTGEDVRLFTALRYQAGKLGSRAVEGTPRIIRARLDRPP